MQRRLRRTWVLATLGVALAIASLAWASHHRAELNRQLIAAVRRKDAAAVGRLLARGADANARDLPPAPLSWRTVLNLLHPAHSQRPAGPSALHLTAASLDTASARLLLDHGANVNARDSKGLTALALATETVDQLNLEAEIDYAHGRPSKKPDLWHAYANILMARGADPNARDANGWTLLYGACCRDDLSFAQHLLQHGARVGELNEDGRSAMGVASGSAVLTELLLQHGADPHGSKADMPTPLNNACFEGKLAVVKLLVARGVDLHKEGADAIDYAVTRGRTEILRYLFAHGAVFEDRRSVMMWSSDPHQDRNWSLLMTALLGGHSDTARLLLDHGAKVNVKSSDGNTALKLARQRGDQAMAAALIRAGARE